MGKPSSFFSAAVIRSLNGTIFKGLMFIGKTTGGTGMKKSSRKRVLTTPYEDFLRKQLKSPKACIAYLNAALDQNDDEAFLLALRDVARAQGGLSRLAQMAKIHRVTLHRMMSKNGNPLLHNVTGILHVMGLKLTVTAGSPELSRSSP